MARSVHEIPKLGDPVENWSARRRPTAVEMSGQYARLQQLCPETHAEALFHAYEGHDQVWDYLPYGPFETDQAYRHWMTSAVSGDDPIFYAIGCVGDAGWLGVASFLRIAPENGSIEVGHINLSPALQGTVAATEAMYLMMNWAFEAGYRRYEWKCDALNIPSRRAAQRLGFSFEGIFRQATVVKGRNRDTAWFSVTDKEWPSLKPAFAKWLTPSNFHDGVQQERLSVLTAPVRVSRDPDL